MNAHLRLVHYILESDEKFDDYLKAVGKILKCFDHQRACSPSFDLISSFRFQASVLFAANFVIGTARACIYSERTRTITLYTFLLFPY